MSLRERTRPSLSNRIVSPTKELLNHQFACGYAAPAPLYNYAAPAYAAPAAPGTTALLSSTQLRLTQHQWWALVIITTYLAIWAEAMGVPAIGAAGTDTGGARENSLTGGS